MTAVDFMLNGAVLTALGSGALWWPAERMLVVSDLHLGKSERLARRGGALLPPYETAETLRRLAVEIERLAPTVVVALGDSFDDPACLASLDPADLSRLGALAAERDWIWIAGNHDPGPLALPGSHLVEFVRGPLTLRHSAAPGSVAGEVSGHYHPKFRLPVGGRAITRACFLHDARRLILPAFGAYTGGLRADSPALRALFDPGARAILTGAPCLSVPMAATTAAQ